MVSLSSEKILFNFNILKMSFLTITVVILTIFTIKCLAYEEKVDLSKVNLAVVPDKFVEGTPFTLNCKASLIPGSRSTVFIVHNKKAIGTFKTDGNKTSFTVNQDPFYKLNITEISTTNMVCTAEVQASSVNETKGDYYCKLVSTLQEGFSISGQSWISNTWSTNTSCSLNVSQLHCLMILICLVLYVTNYFI